jgi:hypothetical protein
VSQQLIISYIPSPLGFSRLIGLVSNQIGHSHFRSSKSIQKFLLRIPTKTKSALSTSKIGTPATTVNEHRRTMR